MTIEGTRAQDQTTEFTGERVIPGAVEPELWNEHISRYQYAALFCSGKSVLDAGCGTGYGTALLASAGSDAIGFDISEDAVEYANQHYGEQARYIKGSANAFPASNHSFDVVTAFEVIEHIENWPTLIQEAERVLRDDGVFLVSTPNKVYYAESRLAVGPNPFHVHEFESGEFEAALRQVFPCVELMIQNRQEAFVFVGETSSGQGKSHIVGQPVLNEAHFLVAVCSKRPIAAPAFVYASDAGNLLREREQYIGALISQVEDSQREHRNLLGEHRRVEQELRGQNEWARSLERELSEAREKLAGEQQNTALMAAGYQHQLDEANRDIESKTNWALDLNAQLAVKSEDLLHALRMLDETNGNIESKTNWALDLNAQLAVKSEDLLHALRMLDEMHKDLEVRTKWAQSLEELAEERTAWASSLEQELGRRAERISDLEQQLASHGAEVSSLQQALGSGEEDLTSLEQQLENRQQILASVEGQLVSLGEMVDGYKRAVEDLEAKLEKKLEETTKDSRERAALVEQMAEFERRNKRLQDSLKARQLTTESLHDHFRLAGALADRLVSEREAIRSSKWLKLGRALGLGPDLTNDPI